MGAWFDEEIVTCKRFELQDRYNDLCHQRAWEHGHGGYTGTFAEARGRLTIQPGTWELEKAREHCMDKHPKWDPAWAYDLGDGRWFIGATCSS